MGDTNAAGVGVVNNVLLYSQKLQTELQKMGLKIKHHEDNLRVLRNQANKLDESILDMQVILGKYHSANVIEEVENTPHRQSEKQTLDRILQHEKTAASIICKAKVQYGADIFKLGILKNVIGVVATVGKVKDDNLSRIFSEYLGLETMLAIVCKNIEGVRALEEYNKNGSINSSSGVHGLGLSVGRQLDGRFLVICLEDLRPYSGDYVADDPQKRLDLIKPRLPTGECPTGFLGFAVNMIDIEAEHLSFVTIAGHGLRETLFYFLFSRLQVYNTRFNMQHALPYISEGAISLDGGIIKRSGLFSLGERKDVDVTFPVSSENRSLAPYVFETQEKIRLANWKKERLAEDIQREEELLNHDKDLFNSKKQELLKYLTDSSHYVLQQPSAAQGLRN